MLIPTPKPFDLASTLLSGQAFRWRPDGEWFYGVVFSNIVKIRQVRAGIDFSCAPDEERTIGPLLQDYLGLGADLEAIYASISSDQRLKDSIARYKGMRILRQDPWECLVSFICSSASNIPRISGNVEDICKSFGRPLEMDDYVRHTFPSPKELATAGEQRLRDLGLGFRAKYLATTARAIADGVLDLMTLREADYEEALAVLTTLDGVGDKVANCVLLFSLDKPEAFPVDVWVDRVLREWYFDGRRPPKPKISQEKVRIWAQERFGPYAGYANQYLFHDRRLQGRG